MTLVVLVAPYDQALSKNRTWGVGSETTRHLPRGREVILRKSDHRAARERLLVLVQAACHGTTWYRAKTWVVIKTYLPRAGVDAINFAEAVADVIKVAIDVDDRWFVLTSDWDFDRARPRYEIEIRQVAVEHYKPCPDCDLTKPEVEFYTAGSRGIDGRCKPCKRQHVKDVRERRLAREAL